MTDKDTKKRRRIAIFSSNDSVWALPAFKKAIPELNLEHNVVGIYLFPERLANLKGISVTLWRLRVFGLWNCILMGVYALKTLIKQSMSPVKSWKALAKKYNLELKYASSPNCEEVVKWTKDNEIDIILIMLGNILKKEIIDAANIGIINKHAGLLPACKGLFPFFWAKIKNEPTGFTFHQVDTGIDTGKILLQTTYPKEKTGLSMLRFYADVFALYPKLIPIAVNNLIDEKFLVPPETIESSYYGLPSRKDFREFQKSPCNVAEFSDIFYSPSINTRKIIDEVCVNKH